MDRKEVKIYKALKEEQKEYPCVWYEEIVCPIRTRWKLSPENLVPWCPVCKQVGYLDVEKRKLSIEE